MVLCCVITHGPACNTVAGRTSPFESKSCVIPTFFPRIPVTLAISFSIPSVARCSGYWLGAYDRSRWSFVASRLKTVAGERPATNDQRLLVLFPKRLNLHIHARRQIELHQRIDRLLRRLENIEQTLVGADLKSFPRLLIHVRRTQHAVFVLHRRERNRSGNLCAGSFGRLHDLARRLIQNAIVVSFQPYANSFFSSHNVTLFTPPG